MKRRHGMYKKITMIDTIVLLVSCIALVALIYLVKLSNYKARMEQEDLAKTGSIYQSQRTESPLYEMVEYIAINEVNQSGWIELYNLEKKADIVLTNCYITVNGIIKYTLTEEDVIKAGEYLCIEGLGRIGTTEHDIIGICDEEKNNLKNLMLPKLEREESYGCIPDGGIQYAYLTASKESTNTTSNRIKKDQLVFSVPGGFYTESFPLELSASVSSTIYYTLDGSEPTKESNVYTEPILIENKSGSKIQYAIAEGIDYQYSYSPSSISIGMVVRAMTVDKNRICSPIETQSYFVGLEKAGDIKDIPVISIVTAPKNLFDYFIGIYVSGRSREDALAKGENGSESANFLNGWEREVHIEYFEPRKDKTYEGQMSTSIIKDNTISTPQKSFLLSAQGGAFPGSSLKDYYNEISNRLVLQTNRDDNNYKIREYLAVKLLSGVSVGTPDLRPCNVFINGEYWGCYMLQAQYDERYIKTHFNVDEEDVVIAQNRIISKKPDYQLELNKLYDFVIYKDLSKEENYDWVKARLDIHNYLEYFCANMYLANAEYGMNQLVMWRSANEQGSGYEDGRWRFLMPELDNTMKNGKSGKIASSSINTFLQYGVTNDVFFRSLIKNNDFKKRLNTVMTDMADNLFTEEKVNLEITVISNQMKKPVENSYRRFIGYPGDSFYASEVDKIVGFFEKRRKYILFYTNEVINRGANSSIMDATTMQ